LEISTGAGERIAEYHVDREVPCILGSAASTESEKLILDILDREILDGVRALVRARLRKDQDDPGYYARLRSSFDFRDGVDEALESLAECLRMRVS
jgi:hypothetical protein